MGSSPLGAGGKEAHRSAAGGQAAYLYIPRAQRDAGHVTGAAVLPEKHGGRGWGRFCERVSAVFQLRVGRTARTRARLLHA